MSLNLAYFLDVAVEKFPDKTALVLDDIRLTYAEFSIAAKKIANILRERGVKKGSKVALMTPNTPHFAIIYYGILYCGATVVPINTHFRYAEIQYQLEDSDSVVFFAWKDYLKDSAEAFLQTETCRNFIVVSSVLDTEPPPVGELLMPLLLAASGKFDIVQTMPEDTALILYTLGTTGVPKGAELSHFNVLFSAQYVRDNVFLIGPDDVGLVMVPLFHPFGQICMLNAGILAGATLSLMTSFDADKACRIIHHDQVTFLAAVPAMFLRMVGTESTSAPDLKSLRAALSGGSALSPEISERFEERFGVRIMECYGLTETGSVAAFNMPNQASKPGSIGVPMWGCEIRTLREDGVFAGVGDVGEIVLRGANLMKGYYKKPTATETTIVDGWFHTGDLARMDEDGYYSIVDTKKDIIVRGGMNIYPREIEKVLSSRSDVAEVCVIGVRDPTWGEEVRAYVALKKGASTTPEELREFCVERMARYKTPREFIILPSLPKGPTGNLLKRSLREMAQNE